eukprot:SAG31_NODE_3867_length_3800_cov_23.537422_6_plen_176_part_00
MEAVSVVTFSLLCQLFEKYGAFIARCNALIEKVSSCSASLLLYDMGKMDVFAVGAALYRKNEAGTPLLFTVYTAADTALAAMIAKDPGEWGRDGEGCYFLVFVQLFEKYGTLIERNTALIEKVSPCRCNPRRSEYSAAFAYGGCVPRRSHQCGARRDGVDHHVGNNLPVSYWQRG